ncbi:MAG: alpha/beta hydrolase [Clostridia bacterium]|nr:alpha/beta hydrolase [Clostridia bacterium]
MKKFLKWGSIALVILIIGGVFYMTQSYAPTETALKAMETDEMVKVTNEDYISFLPVESNRTGIILYPGAKVEPESYAPLMRNLAESSYSTFIAKMTLNFAIFSPNEADQIIKNHPEIEHWVIMGHSLGGVMASQYAFENTNIEKLILLASYPQDKHDFSEKKIQVLSLLGSRDGLLDAEKVMSKSNLLPEDTVYYIIEGGNHAQMGFYGEQSGDLEAEISPEEQLRILTEKILDFLN